MVLVSVIIPCYNEGYYLLEAVESVLNQTFEELEIIIVNDGSTDELTLELLESLQEKGVQIINKKNGGLSSARNAGLSVAKGKYIQFLDSDDYISNNKIEVQMDFLHKNPGISFCYCNTVRFYGAAQDESQYEYQGKDLMDNPFFDLVSLSKHFPFPVHSILLKKSLCSSLGGFDERLKACEDRHLWLRAFLNGYEFGHTDFYGAFYRKHGSSMNDDRGFINENYYLFVRDAFILLSERMDQFTTGVRILSDELYGLMTFSENLNQDLRLKMIDLISSMNRYYCPHTISARYRPLYRILGFKRVQNLLQMLGG